MPKPEQMEETPEEKKQRQAGDVETVIKKTVHGSEAGSVVDKSTYDMLMEDHPMKLDEKQSGYARGGGSEKGSCGGCWHHYTGKTASRKVCEVVRLSDDSNIEEGDVCKFFTPDGETLPHLKG